jgi:hypothetical protein
VKLPDGSSGQVLLGSTGFIEQGASRCADIPLAFYFLATLVLFCLADRFKQTASVCSVLAGLMGGCAAWTKNEGLLFILCVPLARLAAAVPRRGWRFFAKEMALFGLGLLPIAATLAFFKNQHAPPNDLVAGQNPDATLDRLTDWSRYGLIGYFLRVNLMRIAGGPLVVMAVYLLFMGKASRERRRVSITPIVLVVVMMLAGYMGAYVLSPNELLWHMTTSMDRLLFHHWPLVLFGFFLWAATPEEALAANPEPEPAPPGVP